MKKFRVRYRYILPDEYLTPLRYLPIQMTVIEGDTFKSAWNNFITEPGAGSPDYYRLEEYEEAE
jgi:hypothetical protein